MAKKQKISDKLQKKFDKPQFQLGDAVFFSWLGIKQYGYVTKTKQASWGIQYTVESTEGIKYPCGIQIEGQKTPYYTGYILYDDTITIGSEDIKRRIQSGINEPRGTTIIRESARPTPQSTIRDKDSGRNDNETNTKNNDSGKRRSSKSNALSSSTNGNGKRSATKRNVSKNSELEDAIQRQKNFLNGFIKKD